MAKGVVINMLCTNPSCSFSEDKLEIKQAVTVSASSGTHTFKVPKTCPKCKSMLELLNFVSGEVSVEADKIE